MVRYLSELSVEKMAKGKNNCQGEKNDQVIKHYYEGEKLARGKNFI